MLVDSHCHLADPAFEEDRGAVLANARAAEVGHVVVVGESLVRSQEARQLARRYQWLSATAGVHPHDASSWDDDAALTIAEALADPVVVAAGETGLDYHYDYSPRPAQRAAFDAQLELARAAGRPAVIHARDADDDVAAILRNHPHTMAILHSFSSGLGLLRAGIALGHYVSFSGMVTFRSWTLDDAIRETPPDRLLVETDAPYLAPVPRRGKRNEPAFVRHVAERVAVVLDRSVQEIIAETGRNATRVFGTRLLFNPDQEPL